MSHPIERPSNVAIARALCALPLITNEIDSLNFENGCLEEAHKHLSKEPPDIQAAKSEFAEGVAHAFRAKHQENRPEAWLVAACAELLRDVK